MTGQLKRAIHYAMSLGVDRVKITAIAVGIAQAVHSIPKHILAQAWGLLPTHMQPMINAPDKAVHTNFPNAASNVLCTFDLSDCGAITSTSGPKRMMSPINSRSSE